MISSYLFERGNVRVHVPRSHSQLRVIAGQVLGHAFGQGSDQHFFLGFNPPPDFLEQVVHLPLRRTHLDLRVQQTGRPDDLLHHQAAAFLQFVFRGRCRYIGHLVLARFELGKGERPVINRARQAEPVFHQGLLARAVAPVHARDLRDGHVALVDEEQIVVREIIEQGRRRLARGPARNVP